MANAKLTEKQRKARNAYSREWKAKHAKKVKMWNADWAARQKKASKKKATKKVARKHQPKIALVQQKAA